MLAELEESGGAEEGRGLGDALPLVEHPLSDRRYDPAATAGFGSSSSTYYLVGCCALNESSKQGATAYCSGGISSTRRGRLAEAGRYACSSGCNWPVNFRWHWHRGRERSILINTGPVQGVDRWFKLKFEWFARINWITYDIFPFNKPLIWIVISTSINSKWIQFTINVTISVKHRYSIL